MKNIFTFILVILISVNGYSASQGTTFTYQGELLENSAPANGNYEMAVSVYTEAVNGTHLIGVKFLSVPVVDGIFTLDLDFGVTEFMGEERWLEIGVRDFNTPNITVLTPRQLISNSPYAIHSQFVGISGVNSDSIQTGSVTSIKIADNAITQTKLGSSSVGSLQVINASITEAKLADSSVTTAKLSNDSVSSEKIADDAVTSDQLANNSVNTDSILNGTIVAADINNNSVQQRISGTCSAGSSIASILANGTVTCENDDVGNTGWSLTGNAGTLPGTNFIGTSDNKPIVFKANNITALQLIPVDSAGVTDPNVIIGIDTNTINSLTASSIVSGGSGNSINPNASSIGVVLSGGVDNMLSSTGGSPVSYSTIAGGTQNQINNSENATITGGFNNSATSNFTSITGGRNNTASGFNSTVVSGASNTAGGDYSFAAGNSAHVRNPSEVGNGDTNGDENTFIWSQLGVTSTGPNQVIFEANGGFGVGTNAPASPLHVKGYGKSFGALTDEVVMTVEPRELTDDVSLVINKLDSSNESALAFTTNKAPEFDIRTANGGALDFNSYQAGTPQFMMRINDSGTNRIDFNTNLEPQTDNVFDIGSSSFRFAAMHATNINSTNPVNVTSDVRLKDNINVLDYGLSEILNLKPVSYHLINGGNDKKHLGLIAQEVELLIPEIVNKSNDENQTRSMRYTELVPVLIKATQEQQVLIDQQSEQIKELIEINKLLLKHINIKY